MTEQNTGTYTRQETRIVPDVLYDFSVAVMGDSCRSLPVLTLHGHEEGTFEWLEAYQQRQGSWRLFKRFTDFTQNEGGADGADIHLLDGFEQIEIKPASADTADTETTPQNGFSLMDIIFKMATFERAGDLVMQNIEGHSLSDIGDRHFREFAIREAIAFDDRTGLPAPTFEGRIIGNGYFTGDMEKAVKDAWDKKVDTYASEGTYLDALRINGKPAEMLEELYNQLNKTRAYEEIIEYFEENLFPYFRECRDKGFDFEVVIIHEDENDDETSNQTKELEAVGIAMEKLLRDAIDEDYIGASYADVLSADEIVNVQNALISLDIFRAILHARWAIDAAVDNHNIAEDSEAFVAAQIADIQTRYLDNGLEAADKDLVTRAIMDRSSGQSIHIDNTIERIRQDLFDMRDQAEKAARDIQNAPSRSFSARPNKGGPA